MMKGHTIPRNEEIELKVMGSIMSYEEKKDKAMELASSYLKPTCFTIPGYQELFSEMLKMHEDNRRVTLEAVHEWCKGKDFYIHLGGMDWLMTISTPFTYIHVLEDYCKLLYELYTQRRLMEIGRNMYETAAKADPFEMRLSVEKSLEELAIVTSSADSSSYVMEMVLERFKSIKEGTLVSIPTGLSSLDKHTGGLNKGDLVVIGAYPSNGKTSLAVNMVLHAATYGYKVKVYSFEMNSVELFKKQVGLLSGYSPKDIEMRKMFDDPVVKEAIRKVGAMQTTYDNKCRRLRDFVVNIRMSVQKYGVQMAVVDYIQLMTADKQKRLESIGEIANTMKVLATELQIPIVVLSQLRRGEGKATGSPRMDQLKESGDIEAAADVVILPWLPANPPSEQSTVMFKGFEVDTEVEGKKRMFINVPKGRNYGVTKFEAWMDEAQRIYEQQAIPYDMLSENKGECPF